MRDGFLSDRRYAAIGGALLLDEVVPVVLAGYQRFVELVGVAIAITESSTYVHNCALPRRRDSHGG